nr:MAG TPA: hypothetical protein [Caudoviricetes sp.]
MEKDLYKFYDMITFIGSKDVVTYEDEKGNLYTIPILQLILASEYSEYDDAMLKTAIFENKIDKDAKFEKITVKRLVDKSTITKKDKDKGTIVEKDVEVSQIWFIKNAMGLVKACNNKNEAIEYVKKMNAKLLKEAKLID